MKNEEISEDMNYEKAKVFLEKKFFVHVSLKNKSDPTKPIYYNGYIVEVSKDFFFIEDREDGKQLVFFKELAKPIEVFRGVENG